MELHYFTLWRQARFLDEQLRGGVIRSSYTQVKNEQILQIETPDGQLKQLVLSADPRYPYALLRPPGKRARLSTDVLPELLGQRIERVHIPENERVLLLQFADSGRKYLLQLFRNHANFFLLDAQDRVLNAFKHGKKHAGNLYRLKPFAARNPLQISPEQFREALQEDPEAPLEFVLKRRFLFLTPVLIQELSHRLGLSLKQAVGDLAKEQVASLFEAARELLERCRQDAPRIYFRDDFPERFALTELTSLAHLREERFASVNEALAVFIYRRLKLERFYQKKNKLAAALEGKINQLQHVLNQLENLPDEADRRAYLQRIGELLLAQVHQLPRGRETVEVVDYYDPQMRKISVRVNPHLSIQENAQQYFQRAKETAHRQAQLRERKRHLAGQLQELREMRRQLEAAESFRPLQKIERRLKEIHVLQTAEEQLTEASRPYKRYWYQGWEIWVGKNARANDEMTFRWAHKTDWWLHAQGASGSHVVVRQQGRGQNPPHAVLEYAARLAARHSSARHSSYVPVMVTRVRYVRKPRGSAPGAVLPERIKTLFVEPLSE